MGELAERLVAPLLLTHSARARRARAPGCLVDALPHVPQVGALWDEADLVVAIGTDFDAMMTQGWKQPQPPHLKDNVDPADALKNYLLDVLLEADAAAAALAERLGERGGLDLLARCPKSVCNEVRWSTPRAPGGGFVAAIENALPGRRRGERHVHTGILARRLPSHAGAAQALLSAWLGHARLRLQGLGAALAGEGPAVSISGDGGFPSACGEPRGRKAGEHPAHGRVVEDGGYGMIRFDQDRHGDPREGVNSVQPGLRRAGAPVRVRADHVDGLGEHFAMAPEGPRRAEGADVLLVRAPRSARRPTCRRAGTGDDRPARPRARPPALADGRGPRRPPCRGAGARAGPRRAARGGARPASRGASRRADRVIATARPILQSAVAASLAWLVATELVGHTTPFFAPISAVITLGLTVGERRARAVELAIGGGRHSDDPLVALIGTGAWQIGVRSASRCSARPWSAAAAARFAGGGLGRAGRDLQPPDGAFDFTRAVDAATGAAIGLLVGVGAVPVDPQRLARKDLGPVIDGLAARTRLHRKGGGGSTRPRPTAPSRPWRSFGPSTTSWRTRSPPRPTRRGSRSGGARPSSRSASSRLARHLRLAIADARSLARGVGRAIATGDATPPEVSASIVGDSRTPRGRFTCC